MIRADSLARSPRMRSLARSEPRLPGWDVADPAGLPPLLAREPALSLPARLARDLRTARPIPLSQLGERARHLARRAAYARLPRWPIARAKAAAQGVAPATSLPRLATDLVVPRGLAHAALAADRWASGRFCLLGREADFSAGIRWRDAEASPLWLFQLHYLGCVLDLIVAGRAPAAREIVAAWSAEHAERWEATAWHPYPTSLRLSNLCLAAGQVGDFGALGDGSVALVATHTAFLLQHLERDLGGNHLLENACALLLAGRHLRGDLAERAEATAREILASEVPQQVLPDGGHFELSPMYHAIVLHRLLQLTALLGDADPLVRGVLAPAVAHMAGWLAGVLAPDGEIPLLGDSARGEAPPAKHLLALAGVEQEASAGRRTVGVWVRAHVDSGIHVLSSERLWCTLDAGHVCPDALPGHGQADALAIEVWLDGERIVCDPGVHEYTGRWRAWQRSSRAHSTVTVDDRDDAEVYGSFRVGARSTVVGVRTLPTSITATVRTASGAVLTRTLRLSGRDGGRLDIVDEIEAPPGSTIASRLHVAPGVRTLLEQGSRLRARLEAGSEPVLLARAERRIEVEPGIASQRFGEARATVLIVQRTRAVGARSRDHVRTRLSWVLEAGARGERGAA